MSYFNGERIDEPNEQDWQIYNEDKIKEGKMTADEMLKEAIELLNETMDLLCKNESMDDEKMELEIRIKKYLNETRI